MLEVLRRNRNDHYFGRTYTRTYTNTRGKKTKEEVSPDKQKSKCTRTRRLVGIIIENFIDMEELKGFEKILKHYGN